MANDHAFKFSIVMSIYKTDQWLREAVDSIVQQDIGFEDNVQIIFVNDGSPDDSEAICLEYRERWPNNIVYIKKKNGGLASARNVGLRHCDGELVNFFDPDDVLSSVTLSEVYAFHRTHKREKLALIAIPLMFFEAKTGYHPKYLLLGNKNRIVDVDKEPYNFILSSASSFYPANTFDSRVFNESIFGAEDSDLNLRILKDRRRFGYVIEGGAEYRYRQRRTADSIMNQARANPESFLSAAGVYTALLDIFMAEGAIPRYFKESLIYDLRGRIASFDRGIFSHDQYTSLRRDYIRLTKVITKDDLGESSFAKDAGQKLLFLTHALTKKTSSVSPEGTVVMADGEDSGIPLKFFAKNVELMSNKVLIEGIFHTYKVEGVSLYLKDRRGCLVRPKKLAQVPSSHDIKAGLKLLSETIYVRFEVPYADGEYTLVAKGKYVHSEDVPVSTTIFQYSPFVLNSRHIRLWKDGFAVRFYDGILSVSRESRRSIYHHLKASLAVLNRQRNVKAFIVRILLSRRNKYILICDRPAIACDNGEAIFRYINEHEPSIAKYTYFIINKDSPDAKRLKLTGKVAYRGSLKHKYIYLNSKLQMSSHLYLQFLSPFGREGYKSYADVVRRKFIWLQHGITMNDISGAGNKFHQGTDGVVVAARPEQKIFSEQRYFYARDQLLTTGFPRFDYNDNQADGTITIMPTWRKYIASQITEAGLHEKVDAFEHTEFYEKYAQLLSDKTLKEKIAATPGCRLQFVLHPGLMNQRESFERFQSDTVSIVPPDETDYKQIFSRSSLIVTDYSSVFFDFSYMYKPVLFYQFDKDRFFSDHYKKSEHFSYEKNGTGAVVVEHEALVNAIVALIDSNFNVQKKYKKRIDALFLHHDKSSSRRLVAALKKKNYL